MARVSDWFDEWAKTLRARSGRVDWLDPASEQGASFWADFERAFVRHGVTFELADEASSAVCDVPGLYPDNYRPMILEAISRLIARANEQQFAQAGTVDAARLASKGCTDCDGSGFAPRFVHPEIHGKVRTIGGGIAPVGAKVVYPCSCPMGKLIARGLIQPGMSRPALTVDEYPSLRRDAVPWSDEPDNKYRHHPDTGPPCTATSKGSGHA